MVKKGFTFKKMVTVTIFLRAFREKKTTENGDCHHFDRHQRPALPRMVKKGFTLIELLVVLAVVGTLLTLALPRYFSSIDKSKEAVLKENLFQLREAISRYHADKGKYPETLEALAADKYLRKVPLDPVTESAVTWIVVAPEDPQKGGVWDVRSGAPGKGLDGSEYAQW
jgi:general secretion pathway protein G